MSSHVELDGSHGEGGGQILRSALALSILTGRPFKIANIRANREQPGLRPQHVACVKAAGAICGGLYKGASVGSSVLNFEPGEVKAGTYAFGIGTAGATGLVLHTLYLPLALHGKEVSNLTITGGTHVPHSPSYHYNATTWSGHLSRIGIDIQLEMKRPGFYPRGGGEVSASVQPCLRVRGLNLTKCPDLTTAGGFAAVAGLPEGIARRLARRAAERLKREEIESHIPLEEWQGGPGAVVGVLFRQLTVPPLFVAIGERGQPAEAVADAAADEALKFRAAKAPVDAHSADQLVLPLAFSPDASEFRAAEISTHLTTNIETIRKFLDREITVEGDEGSPGVVRIAASGL